MPNFNPKTKIAYGVIDARRAMDLYSEITSDGVNETQVCAEEAVKGHLRQRLADFDGADYYKAAGITGNEDEDVLRDLKTDLLADWLKDAIGPATDLDGRDAEKCAESALDVCDIASGTFDIEEVIDDVMSYLHDHEHFNLDDECQYSYESGGFKYLISYLGGAPLLWVVDGPYATYCRTCSPCVPGAGDLDNCTDEDNGNCIAYCLDPADIDNDEDKPGVLYSVDCEGGLVKLPYQKPNHDQDDK